jgi:hypothetical protein
MILWSVQAWMRGLTRSGNKESELARINVVGKGDRKTPPQDDTQ